MQWEAFVSGMLAGSSGVFVGFPLETLRVRLQTQAGHTEFRGAWDCFTQTVRGEGIHGLYKGLSAPLVGASLTKTVNFGVFGAMQKLQHIPGEEATLMGTTLSGMVSSIAASFILTPVDRSKILLQIQRSTEEMQMAKQRGNLVRGAFKLHRKEKRTFRGPFDVASKLGFVKMYQGHSATMLREGVYGAAYFSSFEFFKRFFASFSGTEEARRNSVRGTTEDIPLFYSFLSGGAAGSTMWTLIFPVDVVKSKMQGSQQRVGSMLQVAKAHYRAEGALAFYKGWRPAVMRSFPVHGTILMMYSLLMDLFLGDGEAADDLE